MKHNSRVCVNFWVKSNHYSNLKHPKVNIQKIIIIMLWVEYFQELVHFIIIKWFGRSGLLMCNRVRSILKCKLWRVKLNITTINDTIINFPMKSKTTGLILGGEIRDLKWTDGGWIFYSIGGRIGSPPQKALDWLYLL